MKKYAFAQQALDALLRQAPDGVEPRVLPGAICDILSLPEMPKVSEEEMEVFHNLFCIMHGKNRNWRSIAQIALPYEQMIGGAKDSHEAKLKSRLGLSGLEVDDTSAVPDPTEQMQLRRLFLDLVSSCIPIEERKQYPHILTLIDSHVVRTSRPPSPKSSGVDAAAWCLVNYFSTAMRWEHGAAHQEHHITSDMSAAVVKVHHEAALVKMEALIDALPWRQKIRDTPPSEDSLFAQLLINAALNRHCLETWAFENRLNESLPMQMKVFEEISKTAPDGLDDALHAAKVDGRVDYRALVENVLARTLAEKKKPLTARVQQHIDEQANAVIASARGDHFQDEAPLNFYLYDHGMRAKALLWIMLTWCYQHEFKISTELPGAKRPEITLVSTRAQLLVDSQDMSTLRRMLATPAFSLQWEKPSAERLELHARHNSAIRALVRSKLEESLKGATLAQWDAAANPMIPRDAYCTLIQHAEVGSLMRDYATYKPVRLPLYG
ncbi:MULTISPECIES: hypothetical protein [Achromobacter]|uniref:Uncharacterized protein n=1 Tax=Achromobacter spanius TaxID=217203 RepID=A0AA42S7J2_9BURK|nr:hypothetical protein [Achromobacter spanius]KNE24869.1 hypothetical protein AFM18_23875 [Achromobacter spanius]MDH0740349.1 hypothetical protein [Achromobacter spanius]